MPVLNRTGMQLCVKKHPLWIRVLLTPQLQDLGDVVLRDATSVACGGAVYGLASCDFDPTPHVSSSVGAAEQTGAEVRCQHGVMVLAPVEYRSSVFTGFSLAAISCGAEGAGGKRQCEPLDTPHPVLSLEMTDGTVVVHKCVYAKAFEASEK